MSAEITKDIESLGATAGDRLPNVAETQACIGLSYLFDLAKRIRKANKRGCYLCGGFG